ncbi:hypothetical protein GCM10020367_14180 [Streptomyces sannanensis]|uniref:TIGR03086 family protein n=1 Tax=Streptomyces sannanensis TaxID=285536 RepID=A0ABP6S7G2_9ACTN
MVCCPSCWTSWGQAWLSPEAWEGETGAGGVTLSGAVALNELVLHGWDLARATSQEYASDEASLEACRALLAQFGDRRQGPFGPVVPVPEGAPLLDRVIGLSGRDPSWSPTQ